MSAISDRARSPGEISGDERRTCSGACGACEIVACSHRGQDTGRDHRARSPRTGRDHRARSPRTGRDHPGRDRRRPRSLHTDKVTDKAE